MGLEFEWVVCWMLIAGDDDVDVVLFVGSMVYVFLFGVLMMRRRASEACAWNVRLKLSFTL